MKYQHFVTAVAALAAFSASAHAEIAIDVIGNSEVSLEGLMQADANWFHNDIVDLNGVTGNDGKDTEFEQRRAEVVLKGKGTTFDWVAGYDGKANKWLDANVKWKLGNSYLIAGQFKQPNSLEELSSTKNNDFISKAMVTNLFGVARRTGVAYADDEANWGYTVNYFGRELTRNLAEGAGYGGRAYWAPFNSPGQYLHLGVSAVDYDTQMDTLRLRVRPDADLATARLIDTSAFSMPIVNARLALRVFGSAARSKCRVNICAHASVGSNTTTSPAMPGTCRAHGTLLAKRGVTRRAYPPRRFRTRRKLACGSWACVTTRLI